VGCWSGTHLLISFIPLLLLLLLLHTTPQHNKTRHTRYKTQLIQRESVKYRGEKSNVSRFSQERFVTRNIGKTLLDFSWIHSHLQFAYLNIGCVSRMEWHPFTINIHHDEIIFLIKVCPLPLSLSLSPSRSLSLPLALGLYLVFSVYI